MDETTLHSLLRKGQQYNASDILLKVGQPPAFRVSGDLHYLQGDKLLPQHTRELAEVILKKSRYKGTLDDLQEFDSSYGVPGVGPLPRERLPPARHARDRAARDPAEDSSLRRARGPARRARASRSSSAACARRAAQPATASRARSRR
jgi:hypothetical protein